MSLSQHSFIGRLTKKPEGRNVGANGSEVRVVSFTVACDADIKGQDADFYNVVAWRGLAENCERYLDQGREVFVQGRPKTRFYDNNEGKRVYVTEIIADKVQFLGGNQGGNGGQGAQAQQQEAPAAQQQSYQAPF
jgi:single-strand DNA-binding protein